MRQWGILLTALLSSAPCIAQDDNPTLLDTPDGQALIEWVSGSTFRFCRAWGAQFCLPRPLRDVAEPTISKRESETRIEFTSEYLLVELDKKSLGLRVFTTGRELLMSETEPAALGDQGAGVERVAAADERFFGLGVRTDAKADARGQIVETSRPFLISSKGYGLHHLAPGAYVFDLAATKPDRYRITLRAAERFDYYFYYGPAPKAVLEEHMLVAPPHTIESFELLGENDLPRTAVRLPAPSEGTWQSLVDSLRSLVHASLSGVLYPAFDIGPYEAGPASLYRRAVQLGSIVPLVWNSKDGPEESGNRQDLEEWTGWRRSLTPFFLTYSEELRDRGFPVIHPIPMQFPNDAQGATVADEFMIGDEALAAPAYTEDGKRSVYLPMGRWTDLRSNVEHAGRQTIQIEAAANELPLFVRSGSILPIDGRQAADPMVLHYFPILAGEFFLYEPEVREYTQVHAAPALDLFRLEVKAKVSRSYEWVIHHAERPRTVSTREAPQQEVKDLTLLGPGLWYYDVGRRNIHIRVETRANETVVTHIRF